MIVGLVGGVASGKSQVASLLAARGAKVLDVDRLGHLVLHEPDVIATLRQHWGDDVLAEDGSIDRAQVARRVFAPEPDGPRELEFLERVTHPRIGARIQTQVEAWLRECPTSIIVLDAALLLKAGWGRWCDQIIYVEAPIEQRRDRAATRGWSEREFATREAAQGPLEMKRQQATCVIDNSGSAAELSLEVERFWSEVVKPAVTAEHSFRF